MTPHCLTTRFTYLPLMLLALLALILQGCGDGVRVLPPSDADPTGYYTNNGVLEVMLDDDTTPRAAISDLQGMVTGGQLMMLSDDENVTYVGTFTVNGNDFSGTVTVYEDDVMTQKDVPLSGMITQGAKMTGTLGGTGAANGTFTLNYAVDNGPVDMGMVIRSLKWWPMAVSPIIPTIAVGDEVVPVPNFSSGSGRDIFSDCGYLGRMEPIAGTHLYTVSVTMETCSPGTQDVEAMPDYSGLASVRSETSSNDRLVLVLTNGAYDFSGEYFECLVIFCTPQ